MTRDEIKQALVEELGRIAPETDAGSLDPGADIREELDIDSFDFLNFIIALHERFKFDIPERDYPKLFSFGGAIDYVSDALNPPRG
jgi:acyl carrier protein